MGDAPVLPAGSRLEQNATYIDLRDPDRQEFTAMSGMEAGPDTWYVPKSEVPYELWNRLLGVRNVIRTGVAAGMGTTARQEKAKVIGEPTEGVEKPVLSRQR